MADDEAGVAMGSTGTGAVGGTAGLTVVVATGNQGKLRDIRAILGADGALAGISFVPIGELGDFADPVEDGETFYDNALIKARAAVRDTGVPWALADDSGLCVDALGGAPGIRSARWAGDHDADANNEAILDALGGVTGDGRRAHLHTTAVLVIRGGDDREEVLRGDGDVHGRIALAPRGDGGFGYAPIFEVDEAPGRTMAELADDERNALSHRARALRDLSAKLVARLRGERGEGDGGSGAEGD